MGLDNGIIIRVYNENLRRETENIFSPFDLDKKEYEIFYWRKCWNVRDCILGVLESRGNYLAKEGDIIFGYGAFAEILDTLEKLYTPEKWDGNYSIWGNYYEDSETEECPDWFKTLVEKLREEKETAKIAETISRIMEDNKTINPVIKRYKEQLKIAQDYLQILIRYKKTTDYEILFYDSF